MFFALLFLYSSILLSSSSTCFSVPLADNLLTNWVKSNGLYPGGGGGGHGQHQHTQLEDVRVAGYAEDRANQQLKLQQMVGLQAEQQYNVSGVLRFRPMAELTCNETLIVYFVNYCNKAAYSRVRRDMIDAERQELTRLNNELINPQILKSLLLESSPLQYSRQSKRSVFESDYQVVQSIVNGCCIENARTCNLEFTKQRLQDQCKPAPHGPHNLLAP